MEKDSGAVDDSRNLLSQTPVEIVSNRLGHLAQYVVEALITAIGIRRIPTPQILQTPREFAVEQLLSRIMRSVVHIRAAVAADRPRAIDGVYLV